MGCSGISFSYSSEDGYVPSQCNPIPSNFTVVDEYQGDGCCCVMVNYPDCNNYEGDKILVFISYTVGDIKAMSSLDPHFSEFGISPFARFKPTPQGWTIAKLLVKSMSKVRP